MISGHSFAHGFAQQRDCLPLPYQILEPARTPENLLALPDQIARWDRTVNEFAVLAARGRLTNDVLERARFGVDVLHLVGENLKMGIGCTLLAVDADGDVLGALIYFLLPKNEATISLVAIDPRFMPGSPLNTQIRGVGTALVAVASQRMLAAGVETVFLHPLDGEAERFWRARGFATCGLGGLLCVRGQDQIAALINGCLASPEVPIDGQVLLCGLPRKVRERLAAR